SSETSRAPASHWPLPPESHSRFGGERSGVEFQLRDIRRTVRTRLREMGAPQDVSEAILSHARPRLIRTYDRYPPVPEMRVADAEDHELSRVQRGQTDWTDQASVVEIVLAHR